MKGILTGVMRTEERICFNESERKGFKAGHLRAICGVEDHHSDLEIWRFGGNPGKDQHDGNVLHSITATTSHLSNYDVGNEPYRCYAGEIVNNLSYIMFLLRKWQQQSENIQLAIVLVIFSITMLGVFCLFGKLQLDVGPLIKAEIQKDHN
ncbi:hypothetical protein TREMEDRAFT_65394 [Tremella mesenterica DSM 1558]|uniref:uncharacterized protein n=1 Tax=Tremella mesenterica (strain ATCC 24925 / CBS 8224 / DSM 1558 / NBRC 9311 / NRRL Y-6157 / RJB 2259-6 / UBC 559-6) TaxID=578456 RepID=UPI00032BEB93|nr:uncharacterized protein TREMEDRAFT_65394 [Tremella mesenterica DSM 1558]EIW66525.1 hypothetical protein TREMEDRAFT_65394 [Tremella mesenterica DSM 1558]